MFSSSRMLKTPLKGRIIELLEFLANGSPPVHRHGQGTLDDPVYGICTEYALSLLHQHTPQTALVKVHITRPTNPHKKNNLLAAWQHDEVGPLWKYFADKGNSLSVTSDEQQQRAQGAILEQLQNTELQKRMMDDLNNLSEHISRVERNFISIQCAIQCLDAIQLLRKTDGTVLQLKGHWVHFYETFAMLRTSAQAMVEGALNETSQKLSCTTSLSNPTAYCQRSDNRCWPSSRYSCPNQRTLNASLVSLSRN
ncbi:hypothetical protein BJ165DRAFT_1497120 [Panaeolus papilionaceus]|nr:hypothetical protein BJ165DRAFT_1497120 [Panaeolus papilionaceus]